jgi:hypothetical protein
MCAPTDAALRAWMTSSEYATAAVESAPAGFALAATPG